MGRIMVYAHHVMHNPSAITEGSKEVDEQLRALGHDWSEEWFMSDDMQHALLIADFGSSKDVATHFTFMHESGFADVIGTAFTIPHMDVVGDVDDEARAVLGRFDFVHYLTPAPDEPLGQ